MAFFFRFAFLRNITPTALLRFVLRFVLGRFAARRAAGFFAEARFARDFGALFFFAKRMRAPPPRVFTTRARRPDLGRDLLLGLRAGRFFAMDSPRCRA